MNVQTDSNIAERDSFNIRILDKIGEGEYGVVYKGVYNGINCAIKRIKHENYFTKNTHWINECMILDNLSGDAKKYALYKYLHYSVNNEFYVVTDFIHGPTVERIIKSNSVSKREKFDYYRDLVKGIGFIHTSNICHLDIKDSNIMYDYVHFRFVDFGVSTFQHMRKNKLYIDRDIYLGAPYTHPPQESIDGINSTIMKAYDYWAVGICLLRWYGMEYNNNFYTTLAYIFNESDVENIKEDPKFPLYGKLSREFLEYLITLITDSKIREIVKYLLEPNSYKRCENFYKVLEIL